MKILNFFLLLFVIFGWTDTAYSQAPASPAWGYDKSSKKAETLLVVELGELRGLQKG